MHSHYLHFNFHTTLQETKLDLIISFLLKRFIEARMEDFLRLAQRSSKQKSLYYVTNA